LFVRVVRHLRHSPLTKYCTLHLTARREPRKWSTTKTWSKCGVSCFVFLISLFYKKIYCVFKQLNVCTFWTLVQRHECQQLITFWTVPEKTTVLSERILDHSMRSGTYLFFF
jgi:hypothetical protein